MLVLKHYVFFCLLLIPTSGIAPDGLITPKKIKNRSGAFIQSQPRINASRMVLPVIPPSITISTSYRATSDVPTLPTFPKLFRFPFNKTISTSTPSSDHVIKTTPRRYKLINFTTSKSKMNQSVRTQKPLSSVSPTHHFSKQFISYPRSRPTSGSRYSVFQISKPPAELVGYPSSLIASSTDPPDGFDPASNVTSIDPRKRSRSNKGAMRALRGPIGIVSIIKSPVSYPTLPIQEFQPPPISDQFFKDAVYKFNQDKSKEKQNQEYSQASALPEISNNTEKDAKSLDQTNRAESQNSFSKTHIINLEKNDVRKSKEGEVDEDVNESDYDYDVSPNKPNQIIILQPKHPEIRDRIQEKHRDVDGHEQDKVKMTEEKTQNEANNGFNLIISRTNQTQRKYLELSLPPSSSDSLPSIISSKPSSASHLLRSSIRQHPLGTHLASILPPSSESEASNSSDNKIDSSITKRKHISLTAWLGSNWSMGILICVILGVLMTLYVQTFLLLKSCEGTLKKSNQSLALFHLVSIMITYLGAAFYVFFPSPLMCSVRSSAHNISYALLFGSLLLRAMHIRAQRSIGLGGRSSRMNQCLTLAFIVGIQIGLEFQQWKFEPPFSTASTLTLSTLRKCSSTANTFLVNQLYISLLVLLLFLISSSARSIPFNQRDGNQIFLVTLSSLPIYSGSLILYYYIPDSRLRDIILSMSMISLATVVLLGMFVPLLIALHRYGIFLPSGKITEGFSFTDKRCLSSSLSYVDSLSTIFTTFGGGRGDLDNLSHGSASSSSRKRKKEHNYSSLPKHLVKKYFQDFEYSRRNSSNELDNNFFTRVRATGTNLYSASPPYNHLRNSVGSSCCGTTGTGYGTVGTRLESCCLNSPTSPNLLSYHHRKSSPPNLLNNQHQDHLHFWGNQEFHPQPIAGSIKKHSADSSNGQYSPKLLSVSETYINGRECKSCSPGDKSSPTASENNDNQSSPIITSRRSSTQILMANPLYEGGQGFRSAYP